MITINGKRFYGDSVIIVNGRILRGGTQGQPMQFDEWKKEDGSDIDRIAIKAELANVNISVSNSQKIEAHFYGSATVSGDVNFDFSVVNRELRISLEIVGNCEDEDFELDITIPRKIFKLISAKSLSTDIIVNEGVFAKRFEAKTQSGDIEINATVSELSAKTMSGNVRLYINAIQDVAIKSSTMSGNVLARFNNIKYVNLSANTMSGNIRNHHRGRKGFTADVNVSTMSGNVRIL